MASRKKEAEQAEVLTEIVPDVETVKEESEQTAEETVFIYVGASIPGTVLSFGRLFRGKLPETVKGLIEERYPEAAPLLIDVRGLPDFTRRARVKGSYEYGLMMRLLNKIRTERSV